MQGFGNARRGYIHITDISPNITLHFTESDYFRNSIKVVLQVNQATVLPHDLHLL